MRYDPDKPHRRSIRLRGYDYTRVGAYAITICIQHHRCLLGDVVAGEVQLTEAGKVVKRIWDELPENYAGVGVDAFVIIMPNHIHGIVLLTRDTGRERLQEDVPTLSLPDVVHRFKSLTTARYRLGVKELGWLPFDRRLWQQNYYEHIIRDEKDLDRIRHYIHINPDKWELDQYHPSKQ